MYQGWLHMTWKGSACDFKTYYCEILD